MLLNTDHSIVFDSERLKLETGVHAQVVHVRFLLNLFIYRTQYVTGAYKIRNPDTATLGTKVVSNFVR